MQVLRGFLVFTLGILPVFAQQKEVQQLTDADRMEIQQLVARYDAVREACANGGQDYAELFTDGGLFINGMDGAEYKGRDALIRAAGGPSCFQLKLPKLSLSLTIADMVIEPSPEGATGKIFLVNENIGKTVGPARVGGYQDVYVKTPKGWRLQSRIHVRAPQVPGEYAGVSNIQMQQAKK